MYINIKNFFKLACIILICYNSDFWTFNFFIFLKLRGLDKPQHTSHTLCIWFHQFLEDHQPSLLLQLDKQLCRFHSVCTQPCSFLLQLSLLMSFCILLQQTFCLESSLLNDLDKLKCIRHRLRIFLCLLLHNPFWKLILHHICRHLRSRHNQGRQTDKICLRYVAGFCCCRCYLQYT